MDFKPGNSNMNFFCCCNVQEKFEDSIRSSKIKDIE